MLGLCAKSTHCDRTCPSCPLCPVTPLFHGNNRSLVGGEESKQGQEGDARDLEEASWCRLKKTRRSLKWKTSLCCGPPWPPGVSTGGRGRGQQTRGGARREGRGRGVADGGRGEGGNRRRGRRARRRWERQPMSTGAGAGHPGPQPLASRGKEPSPR